MIYVCFLFSKYELFKVIYQKIVLNASNFPGTIFKARDLAVNMRGGVPTLMKLVF